MRCNDLQDQINAFAAGELNPARAWRLRRHLGQCPACTGHLQRARTMDLGLTALGVAAPSDPLRQRVFTELEFLASRAAEEELVWHERERLQRGKRLRALAGALAAVLLTGVTVNGLILLREYQRPQSEMYTYKDSMGRTWRLSGTFLGGVNLKDQSTGDAARFIMFTQGNDPDGVLDIDVAGEHFKAQGYGNHLLHSAHNGFLGTVSLTTGTRTNHIARPWKPPVPDAPALELSARAYAWGAEGADTTTGTTWRMHGSAVEVKVQRPGDSKPAVEVSVRPHSPMTREPLSPASKRNTPEFTWTVHGHAGKATGYGVYSLRDETGRVVLILLANRLR
jgi:hypothetical protein